MVLILIFSEISIEPVIKPQVDCPISGCNWKSQDLNYSEIKSDPSYNEAVDEERTPIQITGDIMKQNLTKGS